MPDNMVNTLSLCFCMHLFLYKVVYKRFALERCQNHASYIYRCLCWFFCFTEHQERENENKKNDWICTARKIDVYFKWKSILWCAMAKKTLSIQKSMLKNLYERKQQNKCVSADSYTTETYDCSLLLMCVFFPLLVVLLLAIFFCVLLHLIYYGTFEKILLASSLLLLLAPDIGQA